VDYGATLLECAKAKWKGLESFVGGVSSGRTGAAVMRYLNPFTKALSWQKAWFFLDDDVQYVMIANIMSLTNKPVYSVLDQRRHSDDIYVNDDPFSAPGNQTFYGTASTLWHGGVGYLLEPGSMVLSLSVGERTGAWSAIGTSRQPPETVDLFAAWIEHQDLTRPVSYTIFPGTTFGSFQSKSKSREIIPLQNDAHISAILDPAYDSVSAIFWDASGGTLPLQAVPFGYGPATVTVSGNVAFMVNFKTGALTISDPSQTLTSVDIQIVGMTGPPRIFTVDLPHGPGGLAGSSVTQNLFG
jgi:Polysaccharide lyase family 8, super-sandwich domain/Polysaccharide lyase family 8, C-terminal beta-sandwich domain